MANDLNKVQLIGRLGKDPEIRFTQDGKAVANLTIATSEKWKDKNTGQMNEKTEWTRGVAFGKLAEIMGEYLKKGSQAYFEGKLVTRKWQDQQGQDRYTTEVVISQLQMLGGGQGSQQQGGGQQQSGQQSQAPQGGGQQQAPQGGHQGQYGGQPQQQGGAPQQQGGGAPSNNFDGFDDDIPF